MDISETITLSLLLCCSGLVPIMIGEKAVDTITAELSVVVGARLDSGAVVPITQSSTKHRRRKPPAGATMALDDEVSVR